MDVTSFGADPTGAIDSAPAIQAAIETGNTLEFPYGIYRIESTLKFDQDHAYYCFNGSSFVSDSRIVFFKIYGDDLTFDRFVIDGKGESVSRFAVEILSGASGVTLNQCTILNLSGDILNHDQYALRIDLNDTQNFLVKECSFENISQNNDGDPSKLDFAGAIYFSSIDSVSNPTKGQVLSCLFRNIYNNPTPADKGIDADAIRFYYSRLVGPPTPIDVTISDNDFINVQKRAVKVSGVQGVNILNCRVTNVRTDNRMYEAIRIHGSSNVAIIGLNVVGNASRAISLARCSDITCENIWFNRQPTYPQGVGSSYAIFCDSSSAALEGDSISCRNINVRNVSVFNSKAIFVWRVSVATFNMIRASDFRDDVFDNIYSIGLSEQIQCNDIVTTDGGGLAATALYIKDSRELRFTECELSGWGNPVVQVVESEDKRCEGIFIKNFLIRQTGYFILPGIEGETVSFRSMNNGKPTDGIKNVSLISGEIICAQQTSSADNYKWVLLFECPDSYIDSLNVSYIGNSITNLSSIFFVTHADRTIINTSSFNSTVPMRVLYAIATAGLTVHKLKVCVPNSYISVATSCSNVIIDEIMYRSPFNCSIPNIINTPICTETDCGT